MAKNTADHLRHMMLTRLRARHFSLLSSIAEYGSIHRAAAVHGLSQPGVSKLIKEIEQILGLPLFERTARGTVPTIYGFRAAKTFRSIITEVEYLAQELDVIRAGSGGIIRVGVINFISRSMISEAVLEIWRSDHRFIVHVVNGTTESLVASLHALELDCVIARRSPLRNTAEVKFLPIYHQEPCVIFRRDTGAFGDASELAIESLGAMRWITSPKGTPGRIEFDRTLAAAGIVEPETVVETSDLDLIHNLIRSEPGLCAILPMDIGEELVERGDVSLLPFRGGFEYPEVGIIELPRVARDPNVERFCRTIIAVANRRQEARAAMVPAAEVAAQ